VCTKRQHKYGVVAHSAVHMLVLPYPLFIIRQGGCVEIKHSTDAESAK
jgi:hypothetical protein